MQYTNTGGKRRDGISKDDAMGCQKIVQFRISIKHIAQKDPHRLTLSQNIQRFFDQLKAFSG